MKFIDKIVSYIENHYLNRYWLLLIDSAISVFSTYVTFLIFGYFAGKRLLPYSYIEIAAISLFASVIAIFLFKIYRGVVRHTSIREIWRISFASLGKGIIMLIVFSLFSFLTGRHIGSYSNTLILILTDVVLTFFLFLLMRIVVKSFYDILVLNRMMVKNHENVLIYGDNSDSVSTMNMTLSSSKYHCVGFVKFYNRSNSQILNGLKVYGIDDERSFVKLISDNDIKAVIFPNNIMLQSEKSRLVLLAARRYVKILIKPVFSDVKDGIFDAGKIREIKIEDLLGREEIKIDEVEIRQYLTDKVVFVTGGAGSIGSQLCRQLIAMPIRKLILLDTAETPLHDILLELKSTAPTVEKKFKIVDIRNYERMDFMFRKYKPNIVFHAAAYKHVPMMESNPFEAVMVNVFGTKNMVDFAVKYDVEKFIMISTDKAVNPTNVMGASKRIAEIYVQTVGKAIKEGSMEGKTKFITTRFGNVLGSNGSVIPLFKRQIASGGPVTVTDPRIIRYFMTISEACKLVLEAVTLGEGSDIYVFDMGKPVKIDDLAKNMISLSGLELDKDIKIEYIGLRAGEKLYEELLCDGENTVMTKHDKIFKAKVREYDLEDVIKKLDKLHGIADTMNKDDMVSVMKEIVPEFISSNSRYGRLDKK